MDRWIGGWDTNKEQDRILKDVSLLVNMSTSNHRVTGHDLEGVILLRNCY